MTEPRPHRSPETRPLSVWDVIKVGFCGAALVYVTASVVWPMAVAYERAHAEKPTPVIIEAREEVLPQGVTQLYPRDPAVIVRWIDGAGVGREWRITSDGYAVLRRWVDGE